MLRSLVLASVLLVTATASADQPRMVRSTRTSLSREKIESNVEAFEYRTDAGDKVEEIVGPDTIDVYEYAPSGQPRRAVTSFRGLTFEATITDEEIIVPGFPRLQLAYKDRIRLRSIRADGRTLLSYTYDQDENVRTIRLDSAYSLQLKETRKGWVRHTLRGPSGKILRDRDVPALAANRPQPWEPLDIVRDDLGLGDDWLNHLRGQWNSTGSVITLRNDQSEPFAYLWRFNGMDVGYDMKGQPIFLALYMDSYTRSTQIMWGLPDVFTMTPDGRVGMHNGLPMKSGLDGFWTNRRDGERVLEYRFIDEEAKSNSTGPATELAYNCGSSTVCYSYFDSPYEYCTTTLYYCEAWGGGGGSYDPSFEPTPSGGGSTTITTRFNYLSGTLGAAVGRAISNAKTKLNNSTCQHTFSEFRAQDGVLLADKLRALNTTAADYLTVPMKWKPGAGVADATGTVPCSTPALPVAWTSPGSTTVYVCPRFETAMSSQSATLRVIHEELHSLGLAENPPVAGAPTDADIDNAIANNCQ